MAFSVELGLASIFLVVITTWAWKMLNWVWLKPKRLEMCLRQQGLKGNSYQIFFGDAKELMLRNEAELESINVSDDFVPNVFSFVDKTVKSYGKASFVWMGPIPRLIVMNPQHLRDIFSKHNDFLKPDTVPLINYVADGLILYHGEKWAKHRKIVNPAFHLTKLKNMLPAFHLSCDEMISKWEELVYREGSCELDVWPHLQNLTADIISRAAFGSSYEKGRRIFRLLKEQARFLTTASQHVYLPGWRFLPTKMHKKMKENDNEVKALVRNMIIEREKAMRDHDEAVNDDVLGTLMESNRKEMEENGNEKNIGLSIDDVIKECKLFFFAGQETTAVLLAWTMVLLSWYPNWQARARDEVLHVFGDNKPHFDGLAQLNVVTMILYEVLRLYPPAIALIRNVKRTTQLGELSLPAGVQLFLPTLLVHHDQDLWGNDAKEFKPERFAEGVSKATKGRVSFFPFGWGPRTCVGQNFTMIEAKLALALILQHFTFELSPTYVHSPIYIITLQPKNGVPLVLRKR